MRTQVFSGKATTTITDVPDVRDKTLCKKTRTEFKNLTAQAHISGFQSNEGLIPNTK